MLTRLSFLAVLVSCLLGEAAHAQDQATAELVSQVIAAGGGAEKQLKLFRIKEQLNVSSDPLKKGNERVSVLEPPQHWWLGKKDRVTADKEPATFLVWAWTLGILTDPATKIEKLAGVMEDGGTTLGLRVSGTVTPAMDLHFDAKEHRLVRIDWRSDIHRFSDWKEHDGAHYPARCVGYKKASGKPWYFSEIKELERLGELPPGLMR